MAQQKTARIGKDQRKRESHERILESAATALRASGVEAVSIKEVMAAAGLTHGGFYAHFPDKTALIAESFETALSLSRAEWLADLEGLPPAARLERLAVRYLNRTHRDDPATGCPLPAIGAETARLGEAARDAIARGVQVSVAALGREFAALEKAAPKAADGAAQERAAAFLAQCVGGMLLARIVGEDALSDLFLRASREAAIESLGGAADREAETTPSGEA